MSQNHNTQQNNTIDYFEGTMTANERTPWWWQIWHAETFRRFTSIWFWFT